VRNFLKTKIRVFILLFDYVMHSRLSRMHEFFMLDIKCQFVDVLLKRLKRSSQFIIHMSSFRLNIGAKQLVVDVEDNAM